MEVLAASTTTEVEVLVTAARSTAASSCTTPKELVEDVIKVHVLEVSTTATALSTCFVLFDTFLTMLIVDPTLIFVTKGFISVCNFLKLLFSRVRVI